MQPQTLRQWYDELTVAKIMAMKGQQQENPLLDFKTLRDESFSKDERRNFVCAVSGFANADGGVVIWGVLATKDPADDQIDQVTDTPGLSNARKVLSRLMDLSAQASAPSVVGLDHRVIDDGGPGEPRFVATYVPAGENGPYMAMHGEGRYYRRIGTSFVRMDHGMVADMFGRRPTPDLSLYFFRESDGVIGVRLENSGRGVVEAPYVLFALETPTFIVSPYPGSGKSQDFPIPRTAYGSRKGLDGFVGNREHLIHPGLFVTMRCVQSDPHVSVDQRQTRCKARFFFGALGMARQEGEFVYDFGGASFDYIVGATGDIVSA